MTEKKFNRESTWMLSANDINYQWFVFDAAGKTLGRLAAEIAKVLCGKHKPTYTAHIDSGDGVIVLNADKIVVTGSKAKQKLYRYHTGSFGGMREVSYEVAQAKKPEFIITHAVKGMVPRTKLGRAQMKRLKVFVGDQHNMQAQQPITVNI